VAALLVLIAVLLAAPGAADAGGFSCSEPGSKTIRENSVARVYRESDETITSCSKRTGHREFLVNEVDDTIAEIRLRGHKLAYAYESCLDALGDECDRGLTLEDVRGGRPHFVEIVPWDRVRIVLRRSGAMAWALEAGEGPVLYRRASGGRRKRLDAGGRLEIPSLRLRGSTVSWVRGGTRRTATLR
jgi:hypothetical protein